MSSTDIYGIREDGDAECVFSIRNSFLGVILFWTQLADKYLGGGPEWYRHERLEARMERTWALHSNPQLSEAEWFVLMSTFDNYIIPREHFEHAIKCFDQFAVEHPHNNSHAPHYAEAIRKLRDGGYQGFCLHATTVTDSPWVVQVPGETPDDEPTTRPYNVNQDSKHRFLDPKTRSAE